MTAKIFRNAFLIGFTVLLACILLFFFIMYSNYQAQAYDILEVEAEHIAVTDAVGDAVSVKAIAEHH